MRILLMPSSYPPVLGGLQTAAHSLAGYFRSQGHLVRVVTNRYPRSLPARAIIDEIEIDTGVRPTRLTRANAGRYVTREQDMLKAAAAGDELPIE